MEEFACDANNAIEVQIINSTGEQTSSFHPSYTYQLFGDEERIFGYKALRVNVILDQASLEAELNLSFKDQVPNGKKDRDVLDTLLQHMPKRTKVATAMRPFDSDAFNPPGIAIATYEISASSFTLYKSSLKDSTARTLIQRLEILVYFLVEGGQSIDIDDEQWELYFLYQREPEIKFIGFTSVYPYFWYDRVRSDMHRLRISQFAVLPPYQSAGHGTKMYGILYSHFLSRKEVKELTIEDPSEKFDDLRDRCDFKRLQRDQVFEELTLPFNREWQRNMQRKYKMTQFARCAEMALYERLDKMDKATYKKYRMQVKSRIFRKSKDMLAEMTRDERYQRLDEAYQNVELDYARLLKSMRSRPGNDVERETKRLKS